MDADNCIQPILFDESYSVAANIPIQMQPVKKCSKCKSLKLPTEFSNGNSYCKPCRVAYQMKWMAGSGKTNKRTPHPKWAAERRQRQAARQRRNILANFAAHLIKLAKRRATKKCVPYDLDGFEPELQQILAKGTCQLTGMTFIPMDSTKAFSPSIDRIIPSKGYVRSNVRIIVNAANIMMQAWGLDVMMQVADAIRATIHSEQADGGGI